MLAICPNVSAAQALAYSQARTNTSTPVPSSPLDRTITVDIHDLSIAAAIEELAAAAHVSVTINTTGHLLMTQRLSLRMNGRPLRDAFAKALAGTGYNVYATPSGDLVVAPSTAAPGSTPNQIDADVGDVLGVVQDNDTHEPLFGVVVSLRGTRFSTLTGGDGRYALRRVPVGEYTLTARRLGYISATKNVLVTNDEVLDADVRIVKSRAVLDQVVTTVTGDQELRTMGNTIGTINADSLAPTTPITDFGDLLNARVAGVQVLEPGGITGASPQIEIRGLGSLNASSQPLVYVDGVRVSNSFVDQAPGAYAGLVAGRLNDIVPEDIESIEIVKGPSASTLYGTDAANGVIVVKTKHGIPGRTAWNAYAEAGLLTVDPDQFSPNYSGWGHTPTGTMTTQCTLQAVAADECVQDSITTFTPLRVPSLTPLGTGQHEEGGLQVSGGTPVTRFFVAGNYTSEVGYLTLPRADRTTLDSLQGGVSSNEEHPNAVEKYSARVNVTSAIGHTADINVTSSLLSNDSRIPAEFLDAAMGGAGYRDEYDGWAFGSRPYQYLSNSDDQNADHFTTSITLHWQPTQWFSAHGTAGIDYSAILFDALTPPGINVIAPTGTRTNEREDIALYSVDLGASLNLPIIAGVRSITSVGAQYNRTNDGSTTASASNLLPGATNVSEGTPSGSESTMENVVAGVYAEERLSLNDRLFVTGAVRVDGANSFGSDFKSATYPRVSGSWLLSQEPFFPHLSGLDQIRLRAAYGESGTQPGLSLTTLQTSQVYVDGQVQPGSTLLNIANPTLQPERQTEIEGGADVDLVQQRIHLEFTAYSKTNTNALMNAPLGASAGEYSLLENIGKIENQGYEALITAVPLRTHAIDWTLTASGSINRNQVVSLGPYAPANYGEFGAPGLVAGYPAYSFFDYPILGYKDANGDGILEPNEVTVGNTKRYISPDYPPFQATLATSVGLFGGQIRIGAQFDYRGGFQLPNRSLAIQCLDNACAADYNRNTPLAQQAAAIGINLPTYTYAGFYSDAEFVRFRELSATYDATKTLGRWIGARSLTVTLAARNLALWTRYNGADPETNGQAGNNGSGPVPQAGPYAANGFPIAQYWLLRINAGY